MIVFETATLRSNPGYEAVPLNRLTPAERQSLAAVQPGAAAGGDSYGVLVPSPGSGLMPVGICRETALLFLTLRAPGPPPDSVRSDERRVGHECVSTCSSLCAPSP